MTHTTQSKVDLAYAAAHNDSYRQMARTADSTYFVLLPEDFDLDADYHNPKTYFASRCTMGGKPYAGLGIKVTIDHQATGTGTVGTGDTVVTLID